MAARRRSHKTRDLPPNLYDRDGYYSYRDPRTGKEYGLGRDKRYATTQAIEANMSFIAHQGKGLLDRINGGDVLTIDVWCDRYTDILQRRNVSSGSMAEYRSRINAVRKAMADDDITSVTTKDIAQFLEGYIKAGKPARAKLMRSTLLDMFREAVAEGVISQNPVEATRNARVTVKRSRLSLEDFTRIHRAAASMQHWVALSMELALLTGQRVSDIARMRWSDIHDNRLWVEQKKTGAKLVIPLSISLPSVGLSIDNTLSRCREYYGYQETLIASRSGGQMSVETISRGFVRARTAAGISPDSNPPSFHELRSLAARLYAAEKGTEYAQRLLGHKSAQMSERYIDVRGSEWLELE